jgi:hypothetical protein
VSDYRLDDRGSIPGGKGFFALTSVSKPAPRPTQTPIQWVPGVLSMGIERPGRDTDDSPHLVPRSGVSRTYISTPLVACMAVGGQLYLFM